MRLLVRSLGESISVWGDNARGIFEACATSARPMSLFKDYEPDEYRISSPFNSPSGGGYWTPTNRTKRKHFTLYSNSLGTMLSPSRGGRVGLCALAGGGNQLINFLSAVLSPFGGGSVWIVGWQGEVMLNQMRFFLPSSPFNSPSRGGYWTPTNRAKRKHFTLYSNSLGTMLSPSRGGRVGLFALAGGGNQLINFIPPPLIPPQEGDTGRLQIVLKENILLFTQIP